VARNSRRRSVLPIKQRGHTKGTPLGRKKKGETRKNRKHANSPPKPTGDACVRVRMSKEIGGQCLRGGSRRHLSGRGVTIEKSAGFKATFAASEGSSTGKQAGCQGKREPNTHGRSGSAEIPKLERITEHVNNSSSAR